MLTTPLDALPLWGVLLVVVLALLAAAETGYRIAIRRRARIEDEKEGPVGAMVGSTLGLLAFLLAFTFNMAATRLDARRALVLQEANAIGTTYLRAATLPERGPEIRGWLREYTDLRIQAAQSRDITEARRRSEDLQARMWDAAAAVAVAHPASLPTSLFLASLNEVIDVHAMRLAALRARIPGAIWTALAILAVIAFAAMGYHAGLSRTRRSPAAFAVTIAFAVVVVMIVDIDRPFEGLLTTSQQAMIDARQGLTEP